MGMNDRNGWIHDAGVGTVNPLIKFWRQYNKGALRATVTVEDDRWHLAPNHAERTPTVEEIIDARDSLLPDRITHVAVLPRTGAGYDLHTVHLWETRDPMIHGR